MTTMTLEQMMAEFDSFTTVRRIRVLDAQRAVRWCIHNGVEIRQDYIADLAAAWAACPEHGTPRR